MKFISWNVNGIRACITKGFEERFHELDADIFCLQETKCQQGQVKLELPGYHQYWNYANRRGYSGTAIFTKREPLSAVYGIGIEEHDKEGRVITLEFEEYYFVTVYTPNSQSELRRLEYRMKWEEDFLAYLLKLQEKKPVICCGDLNVAHQEIDLKNPKTNRKNAGFTDEERACFTRALESGFIDTFRYFYPDKEGVYSWWSYRFRAREKNAGWRIDYFLVSPSLKEKLQDAKNVGLLYCSAEPNSQYQVDTVKDALEKLGYTCEDYAFSDSNDLSSVVTTAANDSDVIYAPTDNTVASNTEIINNICLPAKVPVIAGEEGICQACGVATLSISYYDLGYKTGEMAVSILQDGKDISKMPIEYAPKFTKEYNKDICDELGIKIPDGYEAIETDKTAE